MKILFFLESLHSGGAERRVVELMAYLKKNPSMEMMVVLMKDEIHYRKFLELGIPYVVIERKWFKKDPALIFKFNKICRKFKPDIIHSWGYMASFYALFSTIFWRIPLVNSQITRSLPKADNWSVQHFISALNFRFSKIILSNSYAGLETHGVTGKKGQVIYNGVDLNRFSNLTEVEVVRQKFGLKTRFAVIMVASFSNHKDFNTFLEVAKLTGSQRNDVTFIAVGDGPTLEGLRQKARDEAITNMIFTGRTGDVESLVNVADIGILLSNKSEHGEGISNSIIEYMALGKAVIANDAGGTKEIVKNGENAYLVENNNIEEIAGLVENLLNDEELRLKMGASGKNLIFGQFAIDRMGREFEAVYNKIKS